jgi:glutathione S-transferase
VKTRLALAEKGVDWESQLLTLRGDQFDPAYLKLNPNAVVPTIVHDGTVIIESTVIMHYVNDAFPGPPLMPAEATSRAEVHMTTKLVDEYVHNACTVLTFATVNRPSLLQMKPEDPEAALARTPSRARAEAINSWLTQADVDRYSGFQPDPWPKVSEILQMGSNVAVHPGASASHQ